MYETFSALLVTQYMPPRPKAITVIIINIKRKYTEEFGI